METPKYGLFTSIAMIIGIVIGSGIFFKSDNILIATNGNIALGVLLFILAALGIIFGSLTIAQLARENAAPGGVIAYMAQSYGSGFACAFGWFQIFIYYPALTAVIAWVFGIYFCSFFMLPETLEMQIAISILTILLLYVLNIVAAKAGAYFQNASTIIKLIPLITLALAGLFWANPAYYSPALPTTDLPSVHWLTAIAPIAFSFDGWIIATSIAHEIKDSKRNLPLAFIIAPLIILTIYIAYFLGITALLPPALIIELGDAHVSLAAMEVFGVAGAKLMLVFVLVSVLGTVNGIVIGSIRLPYALALRKMLPCSSSLRLITPRTAIPSRSAALSLLITLFWVLLHYLTQSQHLLPNSDVSEIAIVMSYLLYVTLYLYVIKLYLQKKIMSFRQGFLYPCLAIAGSAFIFYGGSQNPLFIYYAAFCLLIMLSGAIYYHYGVHQGQQK